MHIRLYVLYVKSLIGGVPRMGSRVPFALLPFGIHIFIYPIKFNNNNNNDSARGKQYVLLTRDRQFFSFNVM